MTGSLNLVRRELESLEARRVQARWRAGRVRRFGCEEKQQHE